MAEPDPALPSRARVVVVGGGVIGASVAYHLAELGWTDVLLLERDRLTSGTTWHAAGLIVTFGSTSQTTTRMRRYTRNLYARLEAETGQSTGFLPVGFLEVVSDRVRLEEFRRLAAMDRYCGVEVDEVSPAEVASLFPLARTDDLLAGFHVPGDGRANPVDVTRALAIGARGRGARIVEGVPVTEVLTEGGGVTGVRTPYGDVECEYVVNCAGMWARQLAERSGVHLALQANEHYYLVTEPVEGMSRSLPVLEDPASHGYYREEGGGILVGLFETVSRPWQLDGVPEDASFLTLPPDWDRIGPYLETAMRRVPVSASAGIRTLFCGPESFTPDLQPLVGEAPELRRYFVAAGMNSVGILSAGGIGRAVAEWVVAGRPTVDVSALGVDRIQPVQTTRAYRAARGTENLGMVYAPHTPDHHPHTARGARLSPLHESLVARGAWFVESRTWEVAHWFATDGVARESGPWTWDRAPWWACSEAEQQAAVDAVGLADVSHGALFAVQGPGAAAALDRLSTARLRLDRPAAATTPWLDDQGCLDAVVDVVTRDSARFWVVASERAARHVGARLRREAAGRGVSVVDVTDHWARLLLLGPRARDLLALVTRTDCGPQALPPGTARTLDVRSTPLVCTVAAGGVGAELTLFVPAERAREVYDLLLESGAPLGARPIGSRALDCLRLAAAQPEHGTDVANTDTVLAAGLRGLVDLDKPSGFVGIDAVRAQDRAGAPHRRLVHVRVQDPEPLLFHAEVLSRDGIAVGHVTSGAWVGPLGRSAALAVVEADEPVTPAWVAAADWSVDVAGRSWPCAVSVVDARSTSGA